MARSRSEYVVDANVLIDLHVGEVLDALFRTPDGFVAPDLVVVELEEPNGQELMRAGLQSESLPGEGVLAVATVTGDCRWVSVADASALVLAERTDRVLLTGDRRLREQAEQRGVTVHGTLWLLGRMVDTAVLTPKLAATALGRMLKGGRRLPDPDARALIRKWQSGREVE